MGTDLVKAPKINEKFACFKLLIRRSKIHRYGVFAGQRIPANRKVIEYTGKRLNRKEAKIRGDGDYTYLFAVDPYWTLDGAVDGSGAEIINHSCSPNLVSRIQKGHVLYMSLRSIKPGEELTVNYNFDKDVRTFPCSCGGAAGGRAPWDEKTKPTGV
jgi:SET domain-containing protein